jgi:DNA recombination protein RmuC
MNIVYLMIGLAVGFLFAYLLLSRRTAMLKTNLALETKHQEELRQEAARSYEAQIEAVKASAAEVEKRLEALRLDNDRTKEAKADAEATNRSLQAQLDRQAKDLQDQHDRLKQEFENLATQILKTNATEFKTMSTESIRSLVDPLTAHIKEFREKVESCYGDEAKERRSLSDEVRRLVEQNQKIGEDATNLTNALKGESKTQGDWGEMILEDILQRSGLKEGEQYFPQDTLRDESGNPIKSESETQMRPDMVVVYPGNRKIIIDSKVSLTAYTEYANATDRDTEKQKLKEHLASIKKHIDELSAKDYSLYAAEAPEFVMMFIPNESAYYVAVKEDANLWNYAYQKKVLLMNQTNLITALRLALDLWRRDAQEKNILEIVKVASELYDKFVGFTENFKKIGDSLARAQQSYADAFGQLSEGKGNLIGKADRLRSLGITPKKKLTVSSSEEPDSDSAS